MFPHSSKCENVGTNLRFIPKDGPAPHFPDHPRAINIIPSCRLNLQSRAKGLVKAARISGRRPTSGPSPPLDAINHVTWHEKAQGVEKFTTRKRVVAFLSLTNPGYSDEKRNGSYCKLYPGMEKIGRAVGAFTTNLGQPLSFRNSFSPRDSPRKSGVEDRGLSGLDRRQREKGFFFPKFTKSNGPGIHEGIHTPGSQPGPILSRFSVLDFHFGWNNIFQYCWQYSARLPPRFLSFPRKRERKFERVHGATMGPRSIDDPWETVRGLVSWNRGFQSYYCSRLR